MFHEKNKISWVLSLKPWQWHLPSVSGEMSCSVMSKGSPSTTMTAGTGYTNKHAVWIIGMHDLSLISGYKFLKSIILAGDRPKLVIFESNFDQQLSIQ